MSQILVDMSGKKKRKQRSFRPVIISKVAQSHVTSWILVTLTIGIVVYSTIFTR